MFFLEEYDELHTLLPLAYKDPEMQLCKLILHTMPEPETFTPSGFQPRWIFTDGSSKFPFAVATRWASYAVVFPHLDLTRLPSDVLQTVP